MPKLEKAIKQEKRYPDDATSARVCLAEILWLREDANQAVKVLEDGGDESEEDGGSHVALGWLEVCEVKASLIRLAALESGEKQEDAQWLCLEVCFKTPRSRTPELRRWTERLLLKICITMSWNLVDPTAGWLSECL